MNANGLPDFDDVNLDEFTDKAYQAWVSSLDEDEDLTEAERAEKLVQFVHYTTTGRDIKNNTTARISLASHYIHPDQVEEEFIIKRDYDSALGYSNDLPFLTNIEVQAFTNDKDVLRSSVHVCYPMRVGRYEVSIC